MRGILTVASSELRIGLRNRWVLMATLLLAALSLALAFLGAAPGGTIDAGRLTVTAVGLASLATYLVPLIALLLAYDAIVGELDRGTLLLLLSYPLARHEIVLGKFLGQVTVVAIATVLGFGAAALAVAATGDIRAGELLLFWRLVASSVLLGAAFVGLGHLASCLVRDRNTAAGLAIGIWLFLVLLFDMGLLAALVADDGGMFSKHVFPWLLIANPADAYRLLNLSGMPSIEQLSGMAGLAKTAKPASSILLASIVAWILLPLALTAARFQRREP